MSHRLALVLVVLGVWAAQAGPPDAQILDRADKALEEAKAAYETAREKNSVDGFVDAGFKLEEARIKYFVLQEIGSADKQKIAVDRLRAVNQLSKLIHDGKVAISGRAADAPAPGAGPAPGPATAPPSPPEPALAPAAAIPVDVSRRAPIPDPAKQKDAEKLLKELYKDQYAKKGPADRQALARILLDQARKSAADPVALWVVYREAQDVAVQACDVGTVVAAIDESAKVFDIDSMTMKVGALSAAAKNAKAPEDLAALADALDRLIQELMAADQYDAADKAASSALQYAKRTNAPRLIGRSTQRSKEVAEAKARFQAMKATLQTLARTPDDPAANLEMGQFLCFMKGNWDLGLRFIVKGSDAGFKALAEKELALPTSSLDLILVADGWYDQGEKEKLPGRRSQLLAHARELYASALPGAVALQKAKVEKRLEQIETAIGAPSSDAGTVNLFKLIDLKKDVLIGTWFQQGNGYMSKPGAGYKLQIPYNLPAEYDLSFTVERSGDEVILLGLVAESGTFAAVINPGWRAGFELLDGRGYGAQDDSTTTPRPPVPVGKPSIIKASVRRTSAKIFVDGAPVLSWEGGMKRLTPNSGWVGPNPKCPNIGTFNGNLLVTGVTLVPVLDPGKPLR
ncbi:MAG TPA: hypothetical protein VKW04_19530 [Planctomycetota bacterium]|nr:hypothetical protein [Planctomycetota bacterium]